MSSNDEYWARREALEKQWMADNLKNDEAYAKHINGYYDKMLSNIQDRINDQYTKYAGKQGLTMAEAKGAVSTADQVAYAKEAKDAVAEAQKLFKQNGSVSYADFSQELNDHMKLYNATMRINRLEYLKAQIGLEATKAGVKVGVDMSNKVTEDYLAEVKRQAALLGNYLPPSELTNYKQAFEQVMRSGNPGSFSQILWKNTDAMKAQLDMGLSQMLVQGLSPLTIARELRKHLQDTVQSAKYVSERLARTESARAQTLAQRDCYTDLGVKQVRWVAEPSACKTCTAIATEHDGIYSLNDVPAIPVHANCRCSMAPHASRDEMNKLIEAANVENSTGVNPFSEMEAAVGKKNAEKTAEFVDKCSDEQIKKLYQKFGASVHFESLSDAWPHSYGTDVFLRQSSFDGDNSYIPMDTVFHEIGHAIDCSSMKSLYGSYRQETGRTIKYRVGSRTLSRQELYEHVSGSPKYALKATIRDDLWNWGTEGKYISHDQLGPKPRKKAEKQVWLEQQDEARKGAEVLQHKVYAMAETARRNGHRYSDVADMLDGSGLIAQDALWGYGHGAKYFSHYGMAETEFFAEYTSARVANPESLAQIREMFPNACKVCDNIIDDMIKG